MIFISSLKTNPVFNRWTMISHWRRFGQSTSQPYYSCITIICCQRNYIPARNRVTQKECIVSRLVPQKINKRLVAKMPTRNGKITENQIMAVGSKSLGHASKSRFRSFLRPHTTGPSLSVSVCKVKSTTIYKQFVNSD